MSKCCPAAVSPPVYVTVLKKASVFYIVIFSSVHDYLYLVVIDILKISGCQYFSKILGLKLNTNNGLKEHKKTAIKGHTF